MKKAISALLIGCFLFLLNALLVWPLFQGGYTQHIGSIESVFIADARFIFDNWPNLSWNQFWYTGFPFHLFYTPLLPYLMAVSHALAPVISIASWYRIYIGLFYSLTPVSLFFLAKHLTGKNSAGLIAGLIYSLLPSIGYLIPQVGGTAVIYQQAPWRLLTLMLYGEGGHIVGLFFLPLALLFFLKAIKEMTFKSVCLASLFTAILALANIIALIGYVVMFLLILAAEFIEGNSMAKLKQTVMVFLVSYGLTAFWYNLSFIKASLSIGTGGVGGGVKGAYLHLLPLCFLLAPVIFILVNTFKKKRFKLPFITIGWIAIFYLAAFFWFKREMMLLPQPNRYLLEMDMGVAILAAWLFVWLIEKVLPRIKQVVFVFAAISIMLFPLKYYQASWKITSAHKDISQTSEYRLASWLAKNSNNLRVFATGSSAFWLNTFVDVPQLRGGNDGVANPWLMHAVYQINTGENAPEGKAGDVAIWWLRALNVSYMVVNFPSSEEIFHDFINPERFATVDKIEEVYNKGGDTIYKVPLLKPSLAQVVKKDDYAGLQRLRNGADAIGLEKYVNYLDAKEVKEARFSWQGPGRAKIKANLKDDEAIAVQVTYDPGWKAKVNNKAIVVKNDVIGFIYLSPKTTGEVEIDLVYGKTWDVWLGYLLTFLTLVAGVIYVKKIKSF